MLLITNSTATKLCYHMLIPWLSYGGAKAKSGCKYFDKCTITTDKSTIKLLYALTKLQIFL